MNDSIEKIIERSSKLLKSKNLLIAVVLVLLFNILFIINYINHENKHLLITNDLYYLNKQNPTKIIDESLDKPNSKEDLITTDFNENTTTIENDKEKSIPTNNENNKHISIKYIEKCIKICDAGSEINKKVCLNQCFNDNEAQIKESIHTQYVFILFVILIAFICSFFSYIKNNSYKLNANKDYSIFIQRHLLEGYDLLNE